MRHSLLSFAVFSAACALALLLSRPAAAQTVPAGFEDRNVADVPNATALTFTPDGRMLVATKPGELRILKEGGLLAAPALDITGRVCSNAGRGLLGVAVDPNFGTAGNDYVYLYYAFNRSGACPQGQPSRAERFPAACPDCQVRLKR